MVYKQNLHTHTTFCDGKNTPEEMITWAIDKNFTHIISPQKSLKTTLYTSQALLSKPYNYQQTILMLLRVLLYLHFPN